MIKIKSIKKKLFVDIECYFIKFMVHFEYTYYDSVLQIIFFSTGTKLLQLCKNFITMNNILAHSP